MAVARKIHTQLPPNRGTRNLQQQMHREVYRVLSTNVGVVCVRRVADVGMLPPSLPLPPSLYSHETKLVEPGPRLSLREHQRDGSSGGMQDAVVADRSDRGGGGERSPDPQW